jgi:hypothetical protein
MPLSSGAIHEEMQYGYVTSQELRAADVDIINGEWFHRVAETFLAFLSEQPKEE